MSITLHSLLPALFVSLSLVGSASAQTLLKRGAWYEGCIESCTAGAEGGTLQQCHGFCGCLVDEINQRSVVAEYFPVQRNSTRNAERLLEMQKLCVTKVLAVPGISRQ